MGLLVYLSSHLQDQFQRRMCHHTLILQKFSLWEAKGWYITSQYLTLRYPNPA